MSGDAPDSSFRLLSKALELAERLFRLPFPFFFFFHERSGWGGRGIPSCGGLDARGPPAPNME